jgi:hypothetical protein
VSKLKLDQLIEIVTEENIVLPVKNKLLRQDFIEAIVSARHPQTIVEEEDEEKDEEKDEAVAEVVDCAAQQAQETWAKKLIAAKYNVKELIAIVAKDKIVIKPGRKVKEDYVDAIYNARNKV